MRIEMLKIIAALLVLCGAASAVRASDNPSEKPVPTVHEMFNAPTWMGDRLDWCLNWSGDCGKPAAKAFCRAKGYEWVNKLDIDPKIGSLHRTRLIGTGTVCDQSFCDGFKFIECSRRR